MTSTLKDLIAHHDDGLPAIGGPGRRWLNYAGLRRLSQDVETQLRAFGVAVQDRVAIVLPNGPDMATAFLTISQAATTAPLNPNYTEDEFHFYLEDLNAKALVVEVGYEGPALTAAHRLDLQILTLHPDEEAGAFRLVCDTPVTAVTAGSAGANDVSLILHTSGTTSRPKIVPLLQSNLAASVSYTHLTLPTTPYV